jgi:hypothetical protein
MKYSIRQSYQATSINHFALLKRSRADGFFVSPVSPAAAAAIARRFSSFCFSNLARMATYRKESLQYDMKKIMIILLQSGL